MMPKLISLTISGELLTALISKIKPVPSDAVILKIVPSSDRTYSFDIIITTEEGNKIAERAAAPRAVEAITTAYAYGGTQTTICNDRNK